MKLTTGCSERNGRVAVLVALACAGAACGSQSSVDIGGNRGAALLDYSGDWDGYMEAYQLSDGSDRIRISVGADGQGTARLGDSPLIPPPTDFNVGYPPTGTDPRTAFLFSIQDAHVESSRMRFGLTSTETLAPWCEHQLPVLDTVNVTTPPRYGCGPNTVAGNEGGVCYFLDENGTKVIKDCGWIDLCVGGGACGCTETSCTSPAPSPVSTILVDAALDSGGSQLVGTVDFGLIGTRVTVRLNKVQP